MSRRDVLVLVAIALGCAGLAWGISALTGRSRPRTALAAAPEGASIVAQIDAPALLASPIWQALVAEDGGGLDRVERDCGFDPLARLRAVSIFVIGTETRPLERLGFLARGDLPREELVACVERVVDEDGGAIRRVEIDGVPAIASEHGPSRAAFVGSDGIVGGDELIVREVLRTDRGDAPGADRDAELVSLWQRVQGRGEVIAVARVPAHWRDWLGRLGDEIALDALEQVSAIGLGARIRSGLGLTVALDAGSPEAARGIVEVARAQRDVLLEDTLLRVSPLGAALRRVELDVDRGTVVATVDLDEERLTALVQLVRDQLARRRTAGARRRAARDLVPDETLAPRETPPPGE